MKKVKLVALVLLTAVLLVGTLSACHNRDIVGQWVAEDGSTFVFARNGKGSIQGGFMSGDMTWTTEGNVVSISYSACGMSETREYKFAIDGDTMEWVNVNDSSDTMTLRRSSSSASADADDDSETPPWLL